MLSRKTLAIASLCTIVCILPLTVSAGDMFKTSEFLAWPAESQRAYITTSALAAGAIANMNRNGQAKCIDDWVGQHRADGYQPVIDAMKKLPEYHPMAVTIAVIEKACGSFKYATATSGSP